MGRRTVFMDLQGTLGGEGSGDIRDFEFFPFAIEAIKLVNDNDMLAIIITNQSHIAKGNFTLDEYYDYEGELLRLVEEKGAKINGIYCCPHGKEDNCICKKPLDGLVRKAQEKFHIDLGNSYLIGDMGYSDMVLSKNLGCKGILVKTGVGEGSLNEFRHTWEHVEPYFIASNILEGIKFILKDLKGE